MLSFFSSYLFIYIYYNKQTKINVQFEPELTRMHTLVSLMRVCLKIIEREREWKITEIENNHLYECVREIERKNQLIITKFSESASASFLIDTTNFKF